MDWYEDLGDVMGDLEADADILESIILNSKNEKANLYLRESIVSIKRALASMSDAAFEMATAHVDEDE